MIEAETETAESPIKKAGQMVLTMGSTSLQLCVRDFLIENFFIRDVCVRTVTIGMVVHGIAPCVD